MTGTIIPLERNLLRAIRSGERSAEATVAAAIAALEANASLNLLVGPPLATAPDQARALDRRIAAGETVGPLAGLPVVVKDNIAMAGLPLSGASPALARYVARQTAGVVKRVTDAGAIVVGRANMHELAFGITSANPTFGDVRNPYDPRRTPGGSSGGTAAAIGAGAVLAGLASDTGGSGRIPAAFCGTVGMRPSAGRYPVDGMLNLSTTMDTATAMARTVDGLGLLDAVLAGEADDAVVADLSTLRLGVPRDPFWNQASAAVVALCDGVLARLGAAGVTLVEIDAPEIRALDDRISLPLVLHEAHGIWSRIAGELGITLDDLAGRIASPDVAGVFGAIAAGSNVADDAYRAMLGVQVELKRVYAALFADHRLDGLVFPTTPITAPPGAPGEITIDGRATTLFHALTSIETPASLAGIPGISIPAGLDAGGLPFAIEIDAPAGRDRRLIAIARAVEALLGPVARPAA